MFSLNQYPFVSIFLKDKCSNHQYYFHLFEWSLMSFFSSYNLLFSLNNSICVHNSQAIHLVCMCSFSAGALFNRARLFRRIQQFDKAIKYYDQFLKYNPD